jgi:hypothetical protein
VQSGGFRGLEKADRRGSGRGGGFMEDTRRRFIAGYAIFTLLFLSGVFIYTLFRIDMLSHDNKATVETVTDRLRTDLVLKFALKGNFSEHEVATLFKRALEDEKLLLVVVLSSRDYGLIKAVGKSTDFFVPAQFNDPMRRVEFKKPLGTSELEGGKTVLTLTYKTVSLDARLNVLYTSFSTDDTTRLSREILFILLGFFVLTLIMIIVVSAVSSREDRIVADVLARRPVEEEIDLPVFPSRPAPVQRPPAQPVSLPGRERMEAEAADAEVETVDELKTDEDEILTDEDKLPTDEDELPTDEDELPTGGIESPGEIPELRDTPSEVDAGPAENLEWSEEEREARKRERLEERSGLVKPEYFRERLGNEIERAVSFGEDLSLIFISAAGIDRWSESATAILHHCFGNPELAFEFESDTAAVVAPGLSIDAAIKAAKLAYKRLTGEGLRVCLGITARNGRPVTPSLFIEEGSQALAQAERGGQSPIIAFRADADKYNDFVGNN